MPKIVEWRGVSGLVAAPVLEDSTERFTTGEVIEIAGTSQISKSVDSQNATHYYDNNPAIVISATGADTITIDVSAIPYDVLAKITGQSYDASKGLFIERERDPGSWALGYKTKKTDGTEIYVWRQKGTFAIPDETNQTEDDGTDANGQQLVYTGVATSHRYTLEDGKLHAVRAVVVDTSVNDVDETTFFASVQTPDTITAKA
jgi:phi13 family phage major tail protein